MKTLIRVCVIGILITWIATNAHARVIAGDLDNGVAVYYFSSLTESSNVSDYSGNGLHGSLFNGAQLSTVSGRNCLSLGSNRAQFYVDNDNKPLSVSREFSIVAWVKVPQQVNHLDIGIYAYNGPIANIANDVHAGSEGKVYLGVESDSSLYGGYAYDDSEAFYEAESTGRNISNNQWQHIGFVVNSTSIKLYLNGTRIVNHSISGHESFSGTGTSLFVGHKGRGSFDDVGLFKNDLSDAQVKLIYDRGLANIISIAPVDPNGKVATTWGALKKR